MSPIASEPTQQPTLVCPKCGNSILLTEALAAPLLVATRSEYENKFRLKDEALGKEQNLIKERELAAEQLAAQLRQREAELKRDAASAQADLQTQRNQLAVEVARRTQAAVSEQLEQRLTIEKKAIVEDEQRRAKELVAEELAKRDRDNQDKDARIEKLGVQLTQAQRAQAELVKRERDLEDLTRQMPLKIEQEVSGRLDQMRTAAVAEAEQRLHLQLSDKDRTIKELAERLEEASRKAQIGSQQAQGETLELVLEEQLRRQFPLDEFQPVPKGEFGGDTLQVVRDSSGRECGRILWEFKRTRNWQASWLTKLKADQRRAEADLCAIVSQAMPPDIQHFNELDGVWVSSLACASPVAAALRTSLIQLAGQRQSAEGQQTKSVLVYNYLMGPRFRGRIEAIAERWQEMQKDLADEQKVTRKRWAKREMQLQTLLESTSGIWGDLQGIAGRDLAEIEALGDTLLLDTPA